MQDLIRSVRLRPAPPSSDPGLMLLTHQLIASSTEDSARFWQATEWFKASGNLCLPDHDRERICFLYISAGGSYGDGIRRRRTARSFIEDDIAGASGHGDSQAGK